MCARHPEQLLGLRFKTLRTMQPTSGAWTSSGKTVISKGNLKVHLSGLVEELSDFYYFPGVWYWQV